MICRCNQFQLNISNQRESLGNREIVVIFRHVTYLHISVFAKGYFHDSDEWQKVNDQCGRKRAHLPKRGSLSIVAHFDHVT